MGIFKAIAGALAVAGAVIVTGAAPAAAAPSTVDLTISYLATPTANVVTWKLLCEPTGGTHPDPVAACDRLADFKDEDPFAPVPPGTVCRPVADGQERAWIRGVWKSRPVDDEFRRTDSCQSLRWDNLVPVLPAHK